MNFVRREGESVEVSEDGRYTVLQVKVYPAPQSDAAEEKAFIAFHRPIDPWKGAVVLGRRARKSAARWLCEADAAPFSASPKAESAATIELELT
jgi:hypothetical protein